MNFTLAIATAFVISAPALSIASVSPIHPVQCTLHANPDMNIPQDVQVQLAKTPAGSLELKMKMDGKEFKQDVTETNVQSGDAIAATMSFLSIHSAETRAMSVFEKSNSSPEIKFFTFLNAKNEVVTAGLLIDGAVGGECVVDKK